MRDHEPMNPLQPLEPPAYVFHAQNRHQHSTLTDNYTLLLMSLAHGWKRK